MKIISVMTVLMGLAVATGALQTEDEPVCPSEPPALPTFVEIDPAPAKYTGPLCKTDDDVNDETCDPPAGWFEEPGYKLTDKGAEITYTDAGQLYTHECPDKVNYWFEEDQWVKKSFKDGCWKREPVQISSCEVPYLPTPKPATGVK